MKKKEKEMYLKYQAFIMSKVWLFHRTSGFPVNELRSVADEAYCRAIKKHDPARGSFITYLNGAVFNALIRFIKKEKEYQAKVILCSIAPDIEFVPETHWIQRIDLENLKSKVSKDAKHLIDKVLNQPRISKAFLMDSMLLVGWKPERILSAIRNVRESLYD